MKVWNLYPIHFDASNTKTVPCPITRYEAFIIAMELADYAVSTWLQSTGDGYEMHETGYIDMRLGQIVACGAITEEAVTDIYKRFEAFYESEAACAIPDELRKQIMDDYKVTLFPWREYGSDPSEVDLVCGRTPEWRKAHEAKLRVKIAESL